MVVVSEMVTTSDTLQFADVVLPATGWGEKTGTVTNSERRISRQRSFLKPPGQARHDWQALSDLGRRLGFDGFDYTDPSEIYREYAELSAFENNDTRDFDIGVHSDISKAEYDALKPFQWPLSITPRPGIDLTGHDHRFFADGQFYTPDRKARFVSAPFKPALSQPDSKRPFILNTGRIRDQWHTMTRTGKTQRLTAHIGEPFIEIHPDDAEQIGVTAASLVKLSNEFGNAVFRVLATRRVQRGHVFAPMHWSDANSSHGRVDALVAPNVDPVSGQPESKHATVSIEPLEADWFAFFVAREPLQEQFLNECAYWAKAQTDHGWRYELAGKNELNVFDALFPEDISLTFNSRSGRVTRAIVEDGLLISAVMIQLGKPVSADRAWLASLLKSGVDDETRLTILAGRPPTGKSFGRGICSCLGVGSAAIEDAISKGARSVEGIGAATGAGTNCGSCKPEIRVILQAMLASETHPSSIAAE